MSIAREETPRSATGDAGGPLPPHLCAAAAGSALRDACWRALMRVGYRGATIYWYLRRPFTRGVSIAVWCDGEVLLVRNSYRRGLSFPGGGVARGEKPRDAAARELHEEVGLRADAAALQLVCDSLGEREHRRDRVWHFELRLDRRPRLRVDRREVVWACFLPPARALGLDIFPYVRRHLEQRGHVALDPGAR